MNLLLFRESEINADGVARLTDARRLAHLKEVLKVQPQAMLRVGVLGGMMGYGTLIHFSEKEALFSLSLTETSPPKHPIHLIVALPRPKTFRKVLWNAVTFGVEKLTFIQTSRTDKGYWQSPFLLPENVENEMILALEQAVDTMPVTISFYRRFKPYVEDVLPSELHGKTGYLAHPIQADACPMNLATSSVFAIGAEGGWVPFEVDCFEKLGFRSICLGTRILRVEQAVSVLLGRVAQL